MRCAKNCQEYQKLVIRGADEVIERSLNLIRPILLVLGIQGPDGICQEYRIDTDETQSHGRSSDFASLPRMKQYSRSFHGN